MNLGWPLHRVARGARLALLVPVLALSAHLPIGAAPAPANPQPIPANPDFEEDLRAWRVERLPGGLRGNVVTRPDRGAVGRACAILEAPVALTCDPVPLPKGGSVLRVSLRYRTVGEFDTCEVRVRPLDDKGQGVVLPPGQRYPTPRLAAAPEWQSFTWQCVMPAEAAAYDLTFRAHHGTLLVDRVQARLLAPEEWQVPSQGARLKGIRGDVVEVWRESAMKRVSRDAPTPEAEVAAVELTAARGECEVFQLVLRPAYDAAKVRVCWQDLLGPGILRREHGRVAWVDYVKVGRGAPPLGRAGIVPDPLPGDSRRDLRGGQAHPVWLTLQVPSDARPGIYRGHILIDADTRDSYYYSSFPKLRIPVRLRVRAYTLPEEPALKTFARIPEREFEGKDSLRESLRAHRFTGQDRIAPLPVEVTPEGDALMDLEAFGTAAERALDGPGVDRFFFPGLLPDDPAHPEPLWHGLSPASPEFERAFASYARRVGEYLRARGWIGRAVVPLWPPDPREAGAREVTARLAVLLRQAVPDAQFYLPGIPHPALSGIVDIWGCPFPDVLPAPNQAGGPTLWARDTSLLRLDMDSAAIALRAYPWRLKRAGITHVEWPSVYAPPSENAKPGDYDAGLGGRGFYYPNRSGKGAPVGSIRLAMYREGVEDYEALTLLERAHGAARAALKVQDSRFDTGVLLAQLIRPVAPSASYATLDPEVIRHSRARVDRLIELCAGSPPCLIRFEGEGKHARLEGITRPGARVWHGRSRVKVNALGQFSIRGEDPEQVRVEAGSPGR